MKLDRKQSRNIVLGIAALFILYGILDGIFKFNVSQGVVNNVSMVLFVLAFGLLLGSKKTKQDSTNENDINKSLQDSTDGNETNNSIQASTSETEINSSAQQLPDETEMNSSTPDTETLADDPDVDKKSE